MNKAVYDRSLNPRTNAIFCVRLNGIILSAPARYCATLASIAIDRSENGRLMWLVEAWLNGLFNEKCQARLQFYRLLALIEYLDHMRVVPNNTF